MDLDVLRSRIDALDSQIVKSLNERASLSINIGIVKRGKSAEDGLANKKIYTDVVDNTIFHPPPTRKEDEKSHVHVPAREMAVYDRIRKINRGPLADEAVLAIYREIMSSSIALQRDITIAYLGPRGSYSQTAALERFGDSVSYSDQATIKDVFQAVESGAVTYGLVPFENTIVGSVSQTLDGFIANKGAMVRAECYLPIRHCLLGLQEGERLDGIRKVYSHPEALGQVSKWLNENMKGVERVSVSSTSYAAELASKEKDAAAVCNVVCAELYGLNVLRRNIEDMKGNMTRFFVIGDASEGPTSDDRTLIYFTVDHRQPGALCDVLNAFKAVDINLTKIDSRPSGMMAWHYFFFVEFTGHKDDENVKKAMTAMAPFVLSLRVLGSYPNQRPPQ
ncbi:hypothetical protein HK101_001817 [Irineochytrium annulatum]|nr:hypothetical protein HK101_001817 [Irineochytrium annulatum]